MALLFVAGTFYAWNGARNREDSMAQVSGLVTDQASVDQVLAATVPPDAGSIPRIRTGVLIHSVEFANSHNVKINGKIWQRYGADLPADVTRGVMLLEADDATPLEPFIEYESHGDEVKVWSFSTTMHQKFDYGDYPLDRQDIWLRMASPDPYHPVQLVPDFVAYPPWDPVRLQGLDPGMVLADWKPDYTVFSLQHKDFGLVRATGLQKTDELYFNIGVSRGLLGPLLGRIVPVLLLAVLMFLSLFVITTDPDRRSISGFTAFAIIGFAVSTVLVVAVNDNATRAEISATGIAYIEWWFFALYSMTLIVALNATLLITGKLAPLVTWRENLLPKLVFWPLFTGVMYAATVGYLGW
ncbi:hypothetical protein [Nocardia sp. XZ_19_385]|uniref:hypothetical protein n=1 Tax=Nocardia sp. XZ_19_385 TaxID=2769488 RepID=UPI0018907C3D|nr:hypothetical protein [Nocardia sp. XZ_19_385]